MNENKKRMAELPWDEEVEVCFVRERVDWMDVAATVLSVIGATIGAVFFVLYGGPLP